MAGRPTPRWRAAGLNPWRACVVGPDIPVRPAAERETLALHWNPRGAAVRRGALPPGGRARSGRDDAGLAGSAFLAGLGRGSALVAGCRRCGHLRGAGGGARSRSPSRNAAARPGAAVGRSSRARRPQEFWTAALERGGARQFRLDTPHPWRRPGAVLRQHAAELRRRRPAMREVSGGFVWPRATRGARWRQSRHAGSSRRRNWDSLGAAGKHNRRSLRQDRRCNCGIARRCWRPGGFADKYSRGPGADRRCFSGGKRHPARRWPAEVLAAHALDLDLPTKIDLAGHGQQVHRR